MTNKLYKMTDKEINIHTVMEKLKKKEIGIKEWAEQIRKSERHTKRLKKQYILHWIEWIMHKWRGKPSNHQWDETKYSEAIRIIKEKYSDYWPTLSGEKLEEKHNIHIPVSTLRIQMIKTWLWKEKQRKRNEKQFTARERKENYGEMIQYDGSYHKWFEWRNGTDYQCLLVAVDDATWEITAHFALNEWLVETMKFWKEYIETKWKPQSIYLDKYATYKVNYPHATDDRELPTQFWEKCNELNIKLIFANTPQAKWRVEKANWDLQNRLVKDLREEWISDVETANKYLKEVFLPKYNTKFNVVARWKFNLHTQLRDDEIQKIDQIFSEHLERKIANDYTIRFQNKYYQLYRNKSKSYMIRPGDKITVEKHLDGKIKISKNWEYIDFEVSFERPERKHKLLTAPFSQVHLEELKQEVILKEQEEIVEKKRRKKIKHEKKDTYYEKYHKPHPFIANCFT